MKHHCSGSDLVALTQASSSLLDGLIYGSWPPATAAGVCRSAVGPVPICQPWEDVSDKFGHLKCHSV